MLDDIAILTGGKPSSRTWASSSRRSSSGPRHGQEGHDRRPRTRRSSRAPARRPTSTAASSRSASEIETTDSDYDREKLQERLAKLAGGVAQINVGAATETEMKERKARIEGRAAAPRGRARGRHRPRRRRRACARSPRRVDKKKDDDDRRRAGPRRSCGRRSAAPLRLIAENAGVDGARRAASASATQKDRHGLQRRQRRVRATWSRPASSTRRR